ncbi:hypothetical protein [Flavobacterium sp.]|uniref:hypothetical protein n=1 Tax=Flavobacterium sp. TaxID=239 RepID=UPI00391AA869
MRHLLLLLFILFTSCQKEISATLIVDIKPGDSTVETEIFQHPSKLYRDSIFYREFSKNEFPVRLPQKVKIDSLAKGNYTFVYPDMYGKLIKQNVTIDESKIYHLNIYPDVTKKFSKKNIIPNLKDGESAEIKLKFRGCFSGGESSFHILKKNNQIEVSRNNVSKVLDEKQTRYLVNLENSVRQLDYGWCSTSHEIIFILNDRTDTIIDAGCEFHSLAKFEKFLKRNGL